MQLTSLLAQTSRAMRSNQSAIITISFVASTLAKFRTIYFDFIPVTLVKI